MKWSLKKTLVFPSLTVFSTLPILTVVSCSTEDWKKKQQLDPKKFDWSKKDYYDNETGEDGEKKNDEKNQTYKYYELSYLRKGETSPFKKYFKSKQDALEYFKGRSSYSVDKSKSNDPWNLNINRNHQLDSSQTHFEFAGKTYKSWIDVQEEVDKKYQREAGISYRNPDDYIIDASNQLSLNLDTDFNISDNKNCKDGEECQKLQKVDLYKDYHGLAVDNIEMVRKSYKSNVEKFYDYFGKRVYSKEELRSVFETDYKSCSVIRDAKTKLESEESNEKEKHDANGKLEELKDQYKEEYDNLEKRCVDLDLEEIDYYNYNGFSYPSEESVKEALKNDFKKTYQYGGEYIDDTLDFELSSIDQNSIQKVNKSPGLYAIYQSDGEGTLTAPTLISTNDLNFGKTLTNKAYWTSENLTTDTFQDEAMGKVLSGAIEAYVSMKTTEEIAKKADEKIAASHKDEIADSFDEWNPYDDIEVFIGKDDRKKLEDLFNKYAKEEAEKLIDKIKYINPEKLVRGRKLAMFLYTIFADVKLKQAELNDKSKIGDEILVKYLQELSSNEMWKNKVKEIFKINNDNKEQGNFTEKINSFLLLLISPQEYLKLSTKSKLILDDNTELIEFWKDKINDILDTVRQLSESFFSKVSDIVKKAPKVFTKLGSIASKLVGLIGPLAAIVDIFKAFTGAGVKTYSYDYKAKKLDAAGNTIDDGEDYSFKYIQNTSYFKNDDFDPASQIGIITLREPGVFDTYKVGTKIFYDWNNAINYKKREVLEKLKKESSNVRYKFKGENFVDDYELEDCTSKECIVNFYFKKSIEQKKNKYYKDNQGSLWTNKSDARKHSKEIFEEQILSQTTIASMLRYRLKYPDGSFSDPELVNQKNLNNGTKELDADEIIDKKEEIIDEIIDNIIDNITEKK